MKNYYCLIAGLPDISPDERSIQETIQSFRDETMSYLSKKDRVDISLFFLKYDNANLIKLLSNNSIEGFDDRGLFSRTELDVLISAIKKHEDKPVIIPDYMWEYTPCILMGGSDDISHHILQEDTLAAMYYKYAVTSKNKFIAQWFEYNLNINNILTALTARNYDFDASAYLVGDNDIVEQLKQNNAPDFGLAKELPYVRDLIDISKEKNPLAKEKLIDGLKWDWLDNEIIGYNFSVEIIFAYLIKLDILNRWILLDAQKGESMLRSLIDNLKEQVSVSPEI